jgi:hypothetical protein
MLIQYSKIGHDPFLDTQIHLHNHSPFRLYRPITYADEK